jgi:hypothetical protein
MLHQVIPGDIEIKLVRVHVTCSNTLICQQLLKFIHPPSDNRVPPSIPSIAIGIIRNRLGLLQPSEMVNVG